MLYVRTYLGGASGGRLQDAVGRAAEAGGQGADGAPEEDGQNRVRAGPNQVQPPGNVRGGRSHAPPTVACL